VKYLPYVVAALVVLTVFFAIDRPWGGERSHHGKRVQPNEYMYLDSARVDSYLGQLHEGDSSSEDVHETTTEESTLGFEASKVGNASTHRGSQLERSLVVNKSEAERFYELVEALEAQKALSKLNASDQCQLGNELAPSVVRDGSLVMIKNAVVQMPPFLAAYPELRYAGYRLLSHMVKRPPQHPGGKPRWIDEEVFGRVPLTSFDTVDEATLEGARRERQSFEKRVGKNPRIPFSFSIPSDKQHVEACNGAKTARAKTATTAARVTIVLPARFANLTGDPSLLSDPVTIVGLVASDTEGSFGDGLSASAYWPALRSAHARFLRQLGVREQFLGMKPAELRRHLFGAMERSLTYRGHIVAVIPIAMYD
jgi:hypothetical protein